MAKTEKFPFDRSDPTETVDQYLMRIKCENEGIAISTLRRHILTVLRTKSAAKRKWGMDRWRDELDSGGRANRGRKLRIRESRLAVVLESLGAKRAVYDACNKLAELLELPEYEAKPTRGSLYLLPSADKMFPVDIDRINEMIENLEV